MFLLVSLRVVLIIFRKAAGSLWLWNFFVILHIYN